LGEPTKSERFHALLCETSVESDVATFLVMIEAFLAQYDEEQLSQGTIVSFFRSLRRLFSVNLSRDLQGERQGLWGELFMMSRIRGFVSWVPFWHSENNRTFDFSADSKHVEVKTAIGGERVHHFSHRQVYELAGEQTMIASLLLRKEDAGLTLQELIAQARSSLLGGEYYFKLEQAVRQAGMERTDETGPAFDAVEAEQSLSWYKATDAPHFRMPEPPGVSQTHYRVDLSIAPQVTRTELDPWLESWTTLVPNIPRRSLRPVVLRS